MSGLEASALIIFIITYIGIIFTRLPWVNVDRPSAAFFGAVAMLVFGVVTFEESISAIDFNTIYLLLGMMILISALQLDGFFSFIAVKTLKYSHSRFRLLQLIVFITGISSAFLVNDAVVLLFTPVIITICRRVELDPIPYLIAEILASNAGSVMTMTGNPQNMLIGINSGLSYGEFLLRLAPVALLSLLVIIIVIRILWRDHFSDRSPLKRHTDEFSYSLKSMRFSVPLFFVVVIAFFFGKILGLSIPVIALAGGALVLLSGKHRPSEIIRNVDWVLLLFFASLFVVVYGVEHHGVLSSIMPTDQLYPNFMGLTIVHLSSLVMSQIVSNVPFTMLMLPLMRISADPILWLGLASASTLAGNATIMGAMANLIVLESAERAGVIITFKRFLLPGLLVTLITFILSFVVLLIQL